MQYIDLAQATGAAIKRGLDFIAADGKEVEEDGGKGLTPEGRAHAAGGRQ